MATKIKSKAVSADTSNFDNNLSSLDDQVQKALETLDELTSSSVVNFIDLLDTPSSYSGYAGKFVKVNSSADGLEFGEGSSTTVAWGDITGTLSNQTDLQSELDGKSNIGHIHPISDITNLQYDLDNKAELYHYHSISNINGLQDALDNKSNIGHSHIQSSIWYVDSLDGDDTIGDGSPSKPFGSLQKAHDVANPEDTIKVIPREISLGNLILAKDINIVADRTGQNMGSLNFNLGSWVVRINNIQISSVINTTINSNIVLYRSGIDSTLNSNFNSLYISGDYSDWTQVKIDTFVEIKKLVINNCNIKINGAINVDSLYSQNCYIDNSGSTIFVNGDVITSLFNTTLIGGIDVNDDLLQTNSVVTGSVSVDGTYTILNQFDKKFLSLSDTPSSFSGNAGKAVKVNSSANGLEFGDIQISWGNIIGTLSNQVDLQNALNNKSNINHTHTFLDLTDTPSSYPTATNTDYVAVKYRGNNELSMSSSFNILGLVLGQASIVSNALTIGPSDSDRLVLSKTTFGLYNPSSIFTFSLPDTDSEFRWSDGTHTMGYKNGQLTIPGTLNGTNAKFTGSVSRNNKPLFIQDWTDITLSNGWTKYGTGVLQYMVDASGFVHFRGIINPSSATASTFTTISTNTPDYAINVYVPVINDKNRKVSVDTSGNVLISDYNTNTDIINLSQLTYYTTQV